MVPSPQADERLNHEFPTLPSFRSAQNVAPLSDSPVPALPFAAAEVHAVAQILSTASDTVDILTGSSMSLPQPPLLLHIATHGYWQEHQATTDEADLLMDLDSGLLMPGTPHQPYLTGGELIRLPLYGTRLVTIAACDSGRVQAEGGELLRGLRRSLFLAGSQAQLLACWPLPDQATVTIISYFYELLIRGTTLAQALREAQLAAIAQGVPALTWAAFMLSGKGSMSRLFT